MRRVGKGFSGVDTPLFKGMIVAHQDADIADEVTAASATITDATTGAPSAARRRKGVDEAYARELEAELNKTINWDDVIDQVQRKEKEDNDVIRTLTPMWLSWKRQENKWKKKTEKKHLQIVLNDDDDVYTKATPLARKVPVVDYEIYTENNKPYYKIMRADGSHQIFLSFLSLLGNFDKEDLEVLWDLVKERFGSLKPKNFSDDFLLTTLTYIPEADMMEDLISMMKKMIERRYFNGGSRCRWWCLSYWIEAVDRRLRGIDNYVSKPATTTEEAIHEHTIVETYKNATPENRTYFDAKFEAIHMILSGIGDDIYSTDDACITAKEMWIAIKSGTGDDICSIIDACTTAKEMWIAIERLQQGESLNKQDTRQFGNQDTITIAGAKENVGNRVVHQTGIECFNCKEFGHSAKECVPLSAEQGDWLNNTDKEPDEQELEAHYIQHSEQPKTINDTYVVEMVDSNVVPNSSDMCADEEQADQNDEEYEDERVVLANLIANVKLDHDENKKILKQLKKTNASLTHELNEWKSTLEESNDIQDRCKSTLHDQDQHKNDKVWKQRESSSFQDQNEQYFVIQDLKVQLQVKNISIRVIHKTSVGRPQLRSTQLKEKVVQNNSQVKTKQKEAEDHHRISSFSNKTKLVTACNDSLKSITSNVNDVCKTHKKIKPSAAAPHKKTVSSKSTIHKSKSYFRMLYENTRMVRFGNDQFAPILRYGDLVQGNITIKRVYYVEGFNHNLFSIGQFCDADLEVAFRKYTCFIRDLQGNNLLTGNRVSDLYTISLQETSSPTPIYFMVKGSPSQAWLWNHRLSHLKFDTINLLSKKDIVNGLPKMKYVKDQLCSSCELGKAKRITFKTKTVPSSKGRLNLLHMDLCGPMWIESINGKKYIMVIVDDYSRYTWTHFLRSMDETPEVLKDFLKMIQQSLQAQVIIVRTDRVTKFLNKTLYAYFKEEGIKHQQSIPRTPE
nr:retrovirus-related Pol polyprotein from transposon TNT 1-94 [Tanacetum cinerariifolium]